MQHTHRYCSTRPWFPPLKYPNLVRHPTLSIRIAVKPTQTRASDLLSIHVLAGRGSRWVGGGILLFSKWLRLGVSVLNVATSCRQSRERSQHSERWTAGGFWVLVPSNRTNVVQCQYRSHLAPDSHTSRSECCQERSNLASVAQNSRHEPCSVSV